LGGVAGQPGMTRYGILYWCEGYDALTYRGVDEEDARTWFWYRFQKYEHLDAHEVLRIDDLGVLEDNAPKEKRFPEPECSAIFREVKEAHSARMRETRAARFRGLPREQGSITEQQEKVRDSPTPESAPGQPELRYFRIWFWYSEDGVLEREATNEKQAAEFFFKWCQEEDPHNVSSYQIERIWNVEDERDRVDRVLKDLKAAMPTDSASSDTGEQPVTPRLTERDFFEKIRQMKDSSKAEPLPDKKGRSAQQSPIHEDDHDVAVPEAVRHGQKE
jgi:hypothetical protein